MLQSRAARVATTAAVAAALAFGLSGCVAGAPMPVPTQTPSETPTASPAPPADPVLRPGRSAAANKQFFDFVNQKFNAANGMSDGRSIIDNLVAAGFQKQDMEVTPDRTAIDLAADSIIFSVRVDGECLVGQFSASGYHSEIAPLLGTGNCLVGLTRPIDW